MHERKFFETAYAKFLSLIAERRVDLSDRFLPYNYESKSTDLIYWLYEQEFTRELLNTINQFTARINDLVLWEEVISEYVDDDAFELRHEFTNLILYYCLHQPYEFRARLIYSATQLCYTRGIACGAITKAEIDKERDIDLPSLTKAIAGWREGIHLLQAIEKVNSTQYRERTNNYRNRRQHRVAPGVIYGVTNVIERSFPSKTRVAYSFGEAPPLNTRELIPSFTAERDAMISAFEAYWALVREQTAGQADNGPAVE